MQDSKPRTYREFGKDGSVTVKTVTDEPTKKYVPPEGNKEKKKETVKTGTTTNNPTNISQTANQNVAPKSEWAKRLEAIENGKEIQPSPKIINVWDYKKQMSAMELSAYSPFVAIYVVLNDVDGFLDMIQKRYSRSITYYKAKLGTETGKILIPIAATQSVFQTVNFAGGVGINSFDIGYEGTLTQLTGNFNVTIPTLDDFEYDFTSAILINPVNYYLIFHGWMGPGVILDIPWNEKPGSVWEKNATEQINPGWWSMNSVVSWKRDIMPQGNGYSCNIKFGQIYRGQETKEDASVHYDNSKFYTSGDSNFMRGTSQGITQGVNNASDLIAKINNKGIYSGKNLTYTQELINACPWFQSLEQFKTDYSIKKTDEDGNDDIIYSPIYYPLGIVLESVIAEASMGESNKTEKSKQSELIINYGKLTEGELPSYKFTLKSGDEKKECEFKINSAFDIPIRKELVERVLQKYSNKLVDHIKDIINLAPNNYSLTFLGGEKSVNERTWTHDLNFGPLNIDKEARKDDFAIEGNDLIFDFRSPTSLMTEPQLQASGLGLEKLANPVAWSKLFGESSKMSFSLKDNLVNISKTNTMGKDVDRDISGIKIDDNSEFASEMLTKIVNDEGGVRGFLIRALSQSIQFDIHGLAGLTSMVVTWVRGLASGMDGKYVILTIKDTVTPAGYYTTLKLGNLSVLKTEQKVQKQDEKDADDAKNKKEEEERKKTEKENKDVQVKKE